MCFCVMTTDILSCSGQKLWREQNAFMFSTDALGAREFMNSSTCIARPDQTRKCHLKSGSAQN